MENVNEIGTVIEDIIYGIVAEMDNDVIVVTDIIELMSRSLDVSVSWIRDVLKKSKSKIMHANNGIVGFIDGKPITRNSHVYHVNKILERVFAAVKMEELDYGQKEYVIDLLAVGAKPEQLRFAAAA